jgi:hypothetical protein
VASLDCSLQLRRGLVANRHGAAVASIADARRALDGAANFVAGTNRRCLL